ncbi:MAG: hypothetical protein P9M07_01580 [Candidatus Aceula meridiana]|nr:hypothetical protein [Candidatus Aceula meridiana]
MKKKKVFWNKLSNKEKKQLKEVIKNLNAMPIGEFGKVIAPKKFVEMNKYWLDVLKKHEIISVQHGKDVFMQGEQYYDERNNLFGIARLDVYDSFVSCLLGDAMIMSLPKKTTFRDIKIKFVTDQDVKIYVKNKLFWQTDFKGMGFFNRHTSNPNKQWELLRDLAGANGKISWSGKSINKLNYKKIRQDFGSELVEEDDTLENVGFSIRSGKVANKTKKRKQLLSDALKEVFGIDEDPFHPYHEVKSYRIKIQLIDC